MRINRNPLLSLQGEKDRKQHCGLNHKYLLLALSVKSSIKNMFWSSK